MSNIDKIRQEIERRFKKAEYEMTNAIGVSHDGYIIHQAESLLCLLLLDFLDTLSEEPDKDLDDAVSKQICKAADKHIRTVVDAAGHPGWDWATQDLADAFIAGAKWKEDQLMKEVVEGYMNYYEDSGGILMAEAQVGCPYHNGDKVRIIVLPKED